VARDGAEDQAVSGQGCSLATGCREQEVCRLRWDYEVKVPELDASVCIISKDYVKNGEERLVVLNRVARSVVDGMRGLHPTHVFVRAPAKGGAPRPVGPDV
jgi:hypothetical protein